MMRACRVEMRAVPGLCGSVGVSSIVSPPSLKRLVIELRSGKGAGRVVPPHPPAGMTDAEQLHGARRPERVERDSDAIGPRRGVYHAVSRAAESRTLAAKMIVSHWACTKSVS